VMSLGEGIKGKLALTNVSESTLFIGEWEGILSIK